MSLIEFEKVSFGYSKDLLLLDETSFTMDVNNFLLFFGSNGSGKTTFLKLIMNQLQPTSGKITRKLDFKTPYSISNISYLPQREQFNTSFVSVLDIVASSFISSKTFFFIGHKNHKEQAYEVLKKLGIESLANSYFRNLSYGQMQKVLLAYILANPKAIILLDEPMANLDQESKIFFYQQLESIASNRAVMMISHDISLFPVHKGLFSTITDKKLKVYQDFRQVDHLFFHTPLKGY